MPHLFYYRDDDLYCHHSVDPEPQPEAFSVHAHDRMEILYFISGKGSYLVEGNQYPLNPGDVLLLRVAETHKLMIQSGQPYERIAIHFAPELLRPVDPELRLLRPFLERPLGQGNRYSATLSGAERLRTAFEGLGEVPEMRTNLLGRLLMLLTELGGLYDRTALTVGTQSPLVAYVNEHLFDDISIKSVSEAFFLSRSQLCRQFQQATGSPLWEYVTMKRLMAARAMISEGEPAGKVSAACGFSDYSAFYRAYRTHFGHSPKEDAGKQE